MAKVPAGILSLRDGMEFIKSQSSFKVMSTNLFFSPEALFHELPQFQTTKAVINGNGVTRPHLPDECTVHLMPVLIPGFAAVLKHD